MHFYTGGISLRGTHDEGSLPKVKPEGWSELTIGFLFISYSPTQKSTPTVLLLSWLPIHLLAESATAECWPHSFFPRNSSN